MGRKMKLPFLSNKTDYTTTTTTSWPWPSCTQTRTLSFRATNDTIFKTMNSTFSDPTTTSNDIVEEPLHSSSSRETQDINVIEDVDRDPVEAVIQGLRSSESRLFFEPGETSSILEEASNVADEAVPFKESVALSLESRNPYLDFKKSMEEMVEAHGINGWEGLEELLCWYLKINGKDNHGYIVGAFVDLLLGFAFDNYKNATSGSSDINDNNIINISSNKMSYRCSSCDSPYSPLSFCNTSSSSSISSSSTPNCLSSSLVGLVISDQEIETSCLSSLLETDEEVNQEDDDNDVSS